MSSRIIWKFAELEADIGIVHVFSYYLILTNEFASKYYDACTGNGHWTLDSSVRPSCGSNEDSDPKPRD